MKPVKIFLVSAVVLAIVYFIWMAKAIYMASSILGDVWSEKNRIMLQEMVSPDSTHKVGIYEYDAGAFGYTILNVSLVNSDQDYPIEGNLFKTERIPELVKWNGSHEVLLKVFDYGLTRQLPKHETKHNILVKYELISVDK